MALTKTAWTKSRVGSFTLYECDVTATTAEHDAYTLPLLLDTTKKFILMVNTAAAALDGTTLPVDVWAGVDDVGLTGDDSTVAWTAGKGLQTQSAVIADVQAAGGAYSYDSKLTAAAVAAPYLVFNCDGGSTLNAATCHFLVIQAD